MMINKLSKGAIIGLFFMQLLIGASDADEIKKNITLAIFPCTDVVMSFKKFHPLITYLEKETGFDIRMVVPRDYEEFEREIKNKNIDFALQDPNIYVKSVRLYDKDTLIRALTREGATSQSGVVISRKNGSVKKLEDLKGKTVMFGPKLSAARWVAARLLFEENGINIDKDLKAYSNGRCCEDVAFNVHIKAVDAGVVCDHFLEEHAEKQQELGVEAKQFSVICKTKSVPTKVFAARQDINNGIITKVTQALLNLDNQKPAHTKILYQAELGGFQRSKDEYYDGIRMLIGAKKIE
ncbi:MAG: phosphate/phosphite/phosphonate ABC transporter substrate-binding protein [Proteobacteria bacterium]|nr:phosphate/phosphite/phosphonate ABC transporter substrate-binding protein [Pseudomonadota bacterium]